MVRLILAGLLLSGCTTLHVSKSYDDVDPIKLDHRERAYTVRYAYELQPPEVFVHRSVSESLLGVGVRAAARYLDLTDFGRPDEALEKEYIKQVIDMTIRDGCQIAKSGDGGSKLFSVGNSANKYIGTVTCQK